MPLTQIAILKAVATTKPLKLSDGDGLHLLVQPGGRKLWRFRYSFAGRENMLCFGSFPATSSCGPTGDSKAGEPLAAAERLS